MIDRRTGTAQLWLEQSASILPWKAVAAGGAMRACAPATGATQALSLHQHGEFRVRCGAWRNRALVRADDDAPASRPIPPGRRMRRARYVSY